MSSALALALPCPRCSQDLPLEAQQAGGAQCNRCSAHVEASALPAWFRAELPMPSNPVVAGEAGCFFHPDRIAVLACSRCGRFLCPLCRIEWPGGEICVACLEATRTAHDERALPSSRFHFDSLALALSTFPLLLWVLSILTAPVALGFSIFTLRRECSIVQRSKIRFLLAMLLSLLTLAGWTLFFLSLSGHGVRPTMLPIG